MKNILNKYIYLSLFFALSLVISSCSEDDSVGNDAESVVPIIASLTGEAVGFSGETFTYTLTPLRGGSEYIWSVSGADSSPVEGRPDQIDITFTQYTVPAVISVYEKAFNGKESAPMTLEINVLGPPCFYTLETSDTYGDGWNGGYVELQYEGLTFTYAEDDGTPTVFNIGIPDGSDFTFTYVSGGGTGGGPGWESENYFKLTTPDGTVYEEGSTDYSGVPTEGVIVTGTNVCP